jgi:hypothetical protein
LDFARVQKKLAEAGFFLGKMTEQERRTIGDKEPIRLLPERVSKRGHVSQGWLSSSAEPRAAQTWVDAWEKNLTQDEKQLYEFMGADRVAEVHNAGSRRKVAREGVELGIGTHHIDGDVLTIDGPIFAVAGQCSSIYFFFFRGKAMLNHSGKRWQRGPPIGKKGADGWPARAGCATTVIWRIRLASESHAARAAPWEGQQQLSSSRATRRRAKARSSGAV